MPRGSIPTSVITERGIGSEKYYTNSIKDAAGEIIYSPERSYGPRGQRPWYYKDRNGVLLPDNWTRKIDHYLIINSELPEAEKGFAVDERLADITYEAHRWLNLLLAATGDQKEFNLIIKTAGTIAGMLNKTFGAIVSGATYIFTSGEREAMKGDISALKQTIARLEREAKYLQVLKEKSAYNQLNKYLKSEENPAVSMGRSADTSGTTQNWLWYGLAIIIFLIVIKRLKRKNGRN